MCYFCLHEYSTFFFTKEGDDFKLYIYIDISISTNEFLVFFLIRSRNAYHYILIYDLICFSFVSWLYIQVVVVQEVLSRILHK